MSQRGFSITEVLAVMSLYVILFMIAAPKLNDLNENTESPTNQILVYLKDVRSDARSNTTTYQVTPLSGGASIEVTEAGSCDDTTRTSVAEFDFDLPTGTTVNDDWTICFDQMGLVVGTADITVTEPDDTNSIEVLLGGIVREV